MLERRHEPWITLPSFLWLVVLFTIPAAIVFAIAFKPSDPFGGIGAGWTLHTLRSLGDPNYPAILWRTVWLSVATTALCLVLATPTAYFMARVAQRWRPLLVLAIIVPFWTSFLVRIFAWKVVLHPEGPLKHALAALHLVPQDGSLLYHSGAVLLVLVYTELPFAILPLFAAAEKFDFRLLEAARDLGAGPFRSFWTVFLPGIRRGLITATLVTLIPALGSYVVPDLVGGPTSEMLGNKIAQRTFSDRNLPHASALSALLALAVLVPSVLAIAMSRRGEGGRGAKP
ncbi:MAG: ABC transporter permease [Candidatus Eisenbacteria bacterium]|nr:ABC transporter permease [Candidatus Eisenbacteria bacterium]